MADYAWSPLAAKQSDKVTPENKAVFGRYGDQCGHPWLPVSYFTHPFPIPILTAEFKIGCTTFPQCIHTFIILSLPLLSGIFYSYTDGYCLMKRKTHWVGLNPTENVALKKKRNTRGIFFETCLHMELLQVYISHIAARKTINGHDTSSVLPAYFNEKVNLLYHGIYGTLKHAAVNVTTEVTVYIF